MGGLLLADPREHQAQERADQEHRPAVGREGRPAASREVGAVGDVGEVDDEQAAHVMIVASGPSAARGLDRDPTPRVDMLAPSSAASRIAEGLRVTLRGRDNDRHRLAARLGTLDPVAGDA